MLLFVIIFVYFLDPFPFETFLICGVFIYWGIYLFLV